MTFCSICYFTTFYRLSIFPSVSLSHQQTEGLIFFSFFLISEMITSLWLRQLEIRITNYTGKKHRWTQIFLPQETGPSSSCQSYHSKKRQCSFYLCFCMRKFWSTPVKFHSCYYCLLFYQSSMMTEMEGHIIRASRSWAEEWELHPRGCWAVLRNTNGTHWEALLCPQP